MNTRPPSILEILLVPIIGIGVIELLHTRTTELPLLFLPFVTVVFRLFMTQFRQPRYRSGADMQRFWRFSRGSLGVEQLSTLVLLLAQFMAVVAGSPTVPHGLWLIVLALLAVYYLLRFLARQLWIAADAVA